MNNSRTQLNICKNSDRFMRGSVLAGSYDAISAFIAPAVATIALFLSAEGLCTVCQT